jgi:hypothetical protein
MITECIRISLLLLMLSIILCKAVPNNAFAESPPFVRQVVILLSYGPCGFSHNGPVLLTLSFLATKICFKTPSLSN